MYTYIHTYILRITYICIAHTHIIRVSKMKQNLALRVSKETAQSDWPSSVCSHHKL